MKDKTFPTKKKRKPHKPQDQTFSPNIVFSCHAQKAVAKQSDICLWYAKMLDETSKDIEKEFWDKRLSGKTCSSDTMLNENVWSFSRGFVTPSSTIEATERKKHATCVATLLQNELTGYVARFTTHIKHVVQQIRLLRFTTWVVKRTTSLFNSICSNYCKTSCTFLLAILPKL